MTSGTLGAIWASLSGVDYRSAGETIAQVAATILSVYVAAYLVILEVARQRYGQSFANLMQPMQKVWPSVLLSSLSIVSGILASFFESHAAQFLAASFALVLLAVGTACIAASTRASFRDSTSDESLVRLVGRLTLTDFASPCDELDCDAQKSSQAVCGPDKMSELTAIGSVFIRSGDWRALSRMNDATRTHILQLATATESNEVRQDVMSATCRMWNQFASEGIAVNSAVAIEMLIRTVSGACDAWDDAHLPSADLVSALDSLELMGSRALSNGMRELFDTALVVVQARVKHAVAAATSAVMGHPSWSFSRDVWAAHETTAMSDQEHGALMEWFWGAVAPTRILGSWAAESMRMRDTKTTSMILNTLEEVASLAFDERLPNLTTSMVTESVFSQAEEILLTTIVKPRLGHYTADLSPYTLFLLEKSLSSSKNGVSEVAVSLEKLLQQVDVGTPSFGAIVEGATTLAQGIFTLDCAGTGPGLSALTMVVLGVVDTLERAAKTSPATMRPLALMAHESCVVMRTKAEVQNWGEADSLLLAVLLRLNFLIHHAV